MIREYQFHPEAVLDLEEIWEFIGQDSPDAADRVIAEVEAVLEKALVLPHMGHIRRDLTSRSMRFLHVRDYLIGYAIKGDMLWVVAILHGKRDPELMASILAYRQ